MVGVSEPLQFIPMEKWGILQEMLKNDWPRNISAYTALQTQKELRAKGLDYGFDVYCPYGDCSYGMVFVNKKPNLYEVWIDCPTTNTTILENAILSSTVIDWKKEMMVPCSPQHVFELLLRITEKFGVVCEKDMYAPLDLMLFEKTKPMFNNVCLPEGLRVGPLLAKDIDMIDSCWVIRYEGSKWLFDLLIKANQSYGLYKGDELVSWIFINEVGILSHVHTIAQYRGKGYATLLLKVFCNKYLEEKRDLFGYCIHGNDKALRLYEKLGFEKHHYIYHTPVHPKKTL